MKLGDKVLALVLTLSIIVGAVFWLRRSDGDLIAKVTVNGRVVSTIDLSTVGESYREVIETGGGGYNVIEVAPGRIRVVEANCAEQIDVRQGWVSQPYQTIVCLPHRFVITLEETGTQEPPRREVDGVSF